MLVLVLTITYSTLCYIKRSAYLEQIGNFVKRSKKFQILLQLYIYPLCQLQKHPIKWRLTKLFKQYWRRSQEWCPFEVPIFFFNIFIFTIIYHVYCVRGVRRWNIIYQSINLRLISVYIERSLAHRCYLKFKLIERMLWLTYDQSHKTILWIIAYNSMGHPNMLKILKFSISKCDYPLLIYIK